MLFVTVILQFWFVLLVPDLYLVFSHLQWFFCVLAEGTAVKGPTSKKQKTEKQRNRKEKASQHVFTHQLLASTLKVLRNTDWTLITFIKYYIMMFISAVF